MKPVVIRLQVVKIDFAGRALEGIPRSSVRLSSRPAHRRHDCISAEGGWGDELSSLSYS